MKPILLLSLLIWSLHPVAAQGKDVFEIARNGTLTEMKALYEKNPAVTELLNEGKSNPLILAAYHGNLEVALFLCEHTRDLDYNCGRGTALMAAVMGGNTEIINKLLSLHTATDISDDDGKTALMYAVFFNKNDIASLLIKAGAGQKITDHDGRTALDIARFNKNTQLIILLDH